MLFGVKEFMQMDEKCSAMAPVRKWSVVKLYTKLKPYVRMIVLLIKISSVEESTEEIIHAAVVVSEELADTSACDICALFQAAAEV